MPQQATLNIRLPETLKQHGCEVLERRGVSTSDAVRRLFEYLEHEQDLPSQLFGEPASPEHDTRRTLMQSLIGILPQDYSLEDARRDRLAARGV